ncbi:hypothetical protein [Enterococcus faecalis]|uniref:hypothetical protein n=1 Tax=Enterococcus faecalis TaxID=1351 RepID=UPI003CE4A519
MRKVLVDRELLAGVCSMVPEEMKAARKELRAILAQPAEAEGVGKWSELKKLAEKATPGPWWVDSHGHRVSTEDGMQTVFIAADKMGPATRHPETGNLSHWPNDWDASYIVNASPDKILELIAALSAVTAERDRLRDAAGKAIAWLDAEQNGSGVGINRRLKLCRDAENSLRAAMAAKEA